MNKEEEETLRSELTVDDVMKELGSADPEDAAIRAAVDVIDRQQQDLQKDVDDEYDEHNDDDVEEIQLDDEDESVQGDINSGANAEEERMSCLQSTNINNSKMDDDDDDDDDDEEDSRVEDESTMHDDVSQSKMEDKESLDEDDSLLEDESRLEEEEESKLEDESMVDEESKLEETLDEESKLEETLDEESKQEDESTLDGESVMEDESKVEAGAHLEDTSTLGEKEENEKVSQLSMKSLKIRVEKSKIVESSDGTLAPTRLSLMLNKAVIKLPEGEGSHGTEIASSVVRTRKRGRPPKNTIKVEPEHADNEASKSRRGRRRKATTTWANNDEDDIGNQGKDGSEEAAEKPKQRRVRGKKIDLDTLSPEEREQVLEERKQKRREYIKNRRIRMREEQMKERERLGLAKQKSKPGRKKKNVTKGPKVLSDEEKRMRDEKRRQRIEEVKRAKMEKAAKRAERNAALRESRKKRKEEEKLQKEAYDKRMQELKASFLDETTRMSGGIEELQGNTSACVDESTASNQSSILTRLGNFEQSQLDRMTNVTASSLFEYRWPLEGKNSEHYFLQEQLCEYLGIKSFKRRYPDLQRRNVDAEERDFLVEMQVVNEIQVDLGLTAIPSTQVLDIMSNDFYEKYDAYMAVIAERKDRNVRPTSYNTVNVEKTKLGDFVEAAVESAMLWNRSMNMEKKEKRSAYFDMQTFAVHFPQNNRGKMKVIKGQSIGHYPVALIPGQYNDYYQMYTSEELKYFPINTSVKRTPQHVFKAVKKGKKDEAKGKTGELKGNGKSKATLIEKDSSGSSDNSSSSDDGSSSNGEDEDGDDGEISMNEKTEMGNEKRSNIKPIRAIDAEIPGAKCKLCDGDRFRNKLGLPEKLLHCSKCSRSYHPTCLGLHLELLNYVTDYMWECTECKVCSKCHDHNDEDKMLFCDLCDRGYHSYCVGLESIPSGRWQCYECTECISCGLKAKADSLSLPNEAVKWVWEFKIAANGSKIYSHTMCTPCHRLFKRGQYCPECMQVFGQERVPRNELVDCWVCARQHHLDCVRQAHFICASCQRKTLEKCITSTGANSLEVTSSLVHLSGNENNLEPRPSSLSTTTTTLTSTMIPTTMTRTAMRMNSVRNIRRASMESGPMTCDVCLKVYKNRSTLYAHRNRDHGIKASSTKPINVVFPKMNA